MNMVGGGARIRSPREQRPLQNPCMGKLPLSGCVNAPGAERLGITSYNFSVRRLSAASADDTCLVFVKATDLGVSGTRLS